MSELPPVILDRRAGARMESLILMPLTKVAACLSLGAIGVASVVTRHDGPTLNAVIGAILTIASMATVIQYRALAPEKLPKQPPGAPGSGPPG